MSATDQNTQSLTEEDLSKDVFFQRVAAIADEMTAAHGKDFAMGTLVLAARWIASDRTTAGPQTRQ